MNGRTERPDGDADLDSWLAAACGGLTSSIGRVLDVEEVLTTVRRRAVVDGRSLRRERDRERGRERERERPREHVPRDAVPTDLRTTAGDRAAPAPDDVPDER